MGYGAVILYTTYIVSSADRLTWLTPRIDAVRSKVHILPAFTCADENVGGVVVVNGFERNLSTMITEHMLDAKSPKYKHKSSGGLAKENISPLIPIGESIPQSVSTLQKKPLRP